MSAKNLFITRIPVCLTLYSSGSSSLKAKCWTENWKKDDYFCQCFMIMCVCNSKFFTGKSRSTRKTARMPIRSDSNSVEFNDYKRKCSYLDSIQRAFVHLMQSLTHKNAQLPEMGECHSTEKDKNNAKYNITYELKWTSYHNLFYGNIYIYCFRFDEYLKRKLLSKAMCEMHTSSESHQKLNHLNQCNCL